MRRISSLECKEARVDGSESNGREKGEGEREREKEERKERKEGGGETPDCLAHRRVQIPAPPPPQATSFASLSLFPLV